MKKKSSIPLLIIISLAFFYQFLLHSLLPIPADTIVGIYNPFRDYFAASYPRGMPFKNPLITDPIRQQYPWRWLSITLEKQLQLPIWNPYNAAGTPLIANDQSAAFYPLNIVFFILPFAIAWSILIYLQILLAMLGMYWYLASLRIRRVGCLIGAISFAFCGFSMSWLEWGTILQTALWLPYILFAANKLLVPGESKSYVRLYKLSVRREILWAILLVFSLSASFLAGHLQTFFYVFVIAFFYSVFKILLLPQKRRLKMTGIYLVLLMVFLGLTFVQWMPTMQYILLSARGIDPVLANGQSPFLPWQHLMQFISPDYFGNPATGNYFGVWNYGEFIGYIGIISLILALYAMLFRHDRLSIMYTILCIAALLFALPTFFAQLPYSLHMPFIDTSQASRLLFIVDFALSVLAASGWDYFSRNYSSRILLPVGLVLLGLILGWGMTFLYAHSSLFADNTYLTARHNLYLPTITTIASCVVFLLFIFTKARNRNIHYGLVGLMLLIVIFDLLRFGLKYNTFTPQSDLYPTTNTLAYLQSHLGDYRFMSIDNRILPPNFSLMYKLADIGVYDPLYLRSFGEYMIASNRQKPDVSGPFGFYKIITTSNYNSPFIDLLGVKYILSIDPITNNQNLKNVYTEGSTHVYENMRVLPRTFFLHTLHYASSQQDAINQLYSIQKDLLTDGVVQQTDVARQYSPGQVKLASYSENKITSITDNNGQGYLLLTDTDYPIWHAYIDGVETKIYRTDYLFRGIVVPPGHHTITYADSLF